MDTRGLAFGRTLYRGGRKRLVDDGIHRVAQRVDERPDVVVLEYEGRSQQKVMTKAV